MDICDRINQIIENQGLNISSFARRIGVGDQTVRAVVAQRRNKPGYDFILKIAQAYKWLNVEWLITGEGEMKMPTESAKNEGEEVKIGDGIEQMSDLMKYLREKDSRIEQLIEEKTTLKMELQFLKAAQGA